MSKKQGTGKGAERCGIDLMFVVLLFGDCYLDDGWIWDGCLFSHGSTAQVK